jgi:hypothetical protein
MPLSTHVRTASGQRRLVAEGSRLIFGRGPEVDLIIAAGRGLSRRAGLVTAMAAGAWIANISRTHALYVEGDGYQVRLPRMEENGEPANGWFVHAGTALVGSRTMLDDGQSLVVTVTGEYEQAAAARASDWNGRPRLADDVERTDEVAPATEAGPRDTVLAAAVKAGAVTAGAGEDEAGPELTDEAGLAARDGAARDSEGTLLPFYLDPMTKLFLVALIWCRPWLVDPSATRPLPRTPEIARGALEVTGAYHELERFDADPEYRDLLSARVAEHIKVLRRKIADRGLAAADVRLSDEVAVRILIEHGIITSADLSRLDDPAWRSRQEDLWWTQS